MSSRQALISWSLLIGCVGVGLTLTMAADQQQDSKSPEELLSANTIVFIGNDGSKNHETAWQKTAAYEAIYETGIADVVEEVVSFAAAQTGADRDPRIQQAMQHLEAHGVSVSVSLLTKAGPSIPQATIVFHQAAPFSELLTDFIDQVAGNGGIEFRTHDIEGRTVVSTVIPNSPGIEVGFWNEGEHLMLAVGLNAVRTAIAVADGTTPNLASSDVWETYNFNAKGFEASTVCWLDFKSLRSAFGAFPLPATTAKNVNDALTTLGLDNLNAIAMQSGYRERALWSECHVDMDGPRTGLMALAGNEPMTLKDIPSLPASTNGFTVARLSPSKIWSSVTEIIREGSAFGPQELQDQADAMLSNLPAILGFDPESELLEPLGDIACVYTDPAQGLLGTGTGLMVKVNDAKTLRDTVDHITDTLETMSRGQFLTHRSDCHGRELILLNLNGLQVIALTIDDDWLVAGLMPQAVEAALMRMDGKLAAWEPSAKQEKAMKSVPKQFTSLTLGDPRLGWNVLIRLAPVLMSVAQAGLIEEGILPRGSELPVTIADIPPAEIVMAPLFPNVTFTTADDGGIHVTSRSSLPGIPLFAGIGTGNSVAATAIGAALLLPAVQQAREAARRTQSRNNMKQMGLGLHNFHDVHGHFAPGTRENEDLNPNERLSWMAEILPYIDKGAVYNSLSRDEAWDSDTNNDAASVQIPQFRNPATNDAQSTTTHYVGIAGVGEDAPNLETGHERAGIFGYNRKTRIRDITDGTSNTMMVTEAKDAFGPWIAGGKATIRSLTEEPYINGPDGIGGPYAGGVNVLMADGSVRFVSEDIDPGVFEAVSTAAGGEIVGEF